MLTKILVSGVIVVAVAVGVAPPACADPSPFNALGCDSCSQTVKKGGPTVSDQMDNGIQTALTDLQGAPGQH